MGIQINGNTDTISAIDGGLTVSGVDFTGVSAGTTSAPSISPTGDSNTGIFFPSPDTVAIGEGGVEVLRVDSSSNIGIGTTGTGDKLTVLGRVQIQQDSGSNSRLILRGQPGSTYRWNIDNNGSSNDLRIFREDDVTTAGGLVYASLSSSGNLTLNNGNLVIGTAGKGIDFSATANSSGTMTSELLSDYEEGTFTPTLSGSAGSGLTLNANVDTLKYVKIGKQVTIFGRIQISSLGTASGNLSFSGLPFTVESSTEQSHFCALNVYLHGFTLPANYLGPVFVEVQQNTTSGVIFAIISNAGWSPVQVSNINLTPGAYIYVSGSYTTAS